MKYTTLQHLAPCMVAALIALSAGPTHGQTPVHADPIPVDSVPMHVDHPLTDGGQVISGNSISSGSTSSSGSYIGDISSESAGISGTLNGRCYNQPDLFYNFYTEGFANRANAQMYLSPLPIPPNVGHTFFTYQPFYPHEMLYKHTNKFHSCYDKGRGSNRTRVKYSYPPIHQALSNIYWNKLRIPR